MVPVSVVLAFVRHCHLVLPFCSILTAQVFVGLSTVICLLRLFLRMLWLRDYSPAEFVNIFVIVSTSRMQLARLYFLTDG